MTSLTQIMGEVDRDKDRTVVDDPTAAEDHRTEEEDQTQDERSQETEANQEKEDIDQEDDLAAEAIAAERDKAGTTLKARREPGNVIIVTSLVILHVIVGPRRNHVQEHPLAKSKPDTLFNFL